MIKYYCDICGIEVESEEYENKVGIRLMKSGNMSIENEEIHFCNECGKRLNLKSIKKAIIAYGEKRSNKSYSAML